MNPKPALVLFALFCTSSMTVSKTGAALEPGTGVEGSVHDMTRYGGTAGATACQYCHGVHQVPELPVSVTANRVTEVPDASSRICLSCHDGVVAMDPPAGHHRIGFVYGEEGGAKECGPLPTAEVKTKTCRIREKGVRFADTRWTIEERLWPSPSHGGRLVVTCSTCHEVHNRGKDGTIGGKNVLLIVSNGDGRLCFSCHYDTDAQEAE